MLVCFQIFKMSIMQVLYGKLVQIGSVVIQESQQSLLQYKKIQSMDSNYFHSKKQPKNLYTRVRIDTLITIN